jgi:hypothetical protein
MNIVKTNRILSLMILIFSFSSFGVESSQENESGILLDSSYVLELTNARSLLSHPSKKKPIRSIIIKNKRMTRVFLKIEIMSLNPYRVIDTEYIYVKKGDFWTRKNFLNGNQVSIITPYYPPDREINIIE